MSYNLNRITPEAARELYADPREEVLPARPRRVLAAAGALLVMGLFAGGLWLAYVAGLGHSAGVGNGNIPLIHADTRPVKIKPANPGGMAIPDRDLLIYDESRPAVEHLLPPPEQPMARPAPPPPQPSPPAPAASPPAQVNPPSSVQAASPPPTSGTAPPTPAAASADTAAIRAGMKAAAPPEHPARRDEAAEQSASVMSTNPRRVPREADRAEAPPASPDGARLQLGSVRSAASAREEWDRLRRSNPDLLGSLSAGAVRADLGDKGVYYRIETAPVGDTAHASRLCGELRQRHLGCIIVR